MSSFQYNQFNGLDHMVIAMPVQLCLYIEHKILNNSNRLIGLHLLDNF